MTKIRFRQPIFRDGKFYKWNYWGFINDGSFVNPVLSLKINMEEAKKDSQQFTDLYDRNGKEIYEGDIVRWPHLPDYPPEIIRWVQKDCGYYGEKKDGSPGSWIDKGCEVIGNIWESPKLLEEDK